MKEFYKHSKNYRWSISHIHTKYANYKDNYKKVLFKPGFRCHKFILDKSIAFYFNIHHKNYISSYIVTVPYTIKRISSNCA